MKKNMTNNRLTVCSMFILAFAVLFSVWYFGYHYFIIWLEGFSYYSDLPDFTALMLQLPDDYARYAGAFMLQFFKWPALGALLLTLQSLAVAFCLYVIVRRLFESDHLFWIAFLPLPLLVKFQSIDLTASVVIKYLFWIFLAMSAVCLSTVRKKAFIKVPGFLRRWWIAVAMSVVLTGVSAYILTDETTLGRQIEVVARLEHLAENQEWDEILKTVPVNESVENEYKRKYVLLALSEKDMLPEYAFRYGLSSSEDFTFANIQEPLCLNFNVLFYKYLGMYNYQIYQIYQQSVQSLPGMSFDSVRELADAYLKLKDYRLAKKYIDILSHSTCHDSWIEERLPALEAIEDAEPEYTATGAETCLISFLPDMSAMYDKYPQNPKFAHYLLCGILAEKDGDTFYQVFRIIAQTLYGKDGHIPRLYQEALLLNASRNPEILQNYLIEKVVWDRFVDFTSLMEQGKSAQANRKYADTYWAYVY